MNKKRIWALLLAAVMLLTVSACGKETTTTTDGDTNSTANSNDMSATTPDEGGNDVGSVYGDEEFGFQMNDPEEGDTVVILHTSMGDVSIRLFPEAAPKAVENFTTHAKNGYYDGLTFHRVIEDFMIQGGDPKGDGTGGESIWDKAFEDEFDQKLMNIRGSLAMANSGVNTNGSQFFINQGGPTGEDADALKKQYEDMLTQYQSYYDQYADEYGDEFIQAYPDVFSFITANGGMAVDATLVPDEVWELYAEVGGNFHLDGAWRHGGGHTVFGHVYDGMDVVDAIAKVDVDGETNKPLKDVTIESVEVTTYKNKG